MFYSIKGTVDLSDFKKISLINSEKNSSVFLTEDTVSNKQYLQTILNTKYESKEEQQAFYQEIQKITNVSQHPFLLNIVGFSLINYDNQPFPTVFYDYHHTKTLSDLLSNPHIFGPKKTLTSSKKFTILLGMANAMSHIYKNFLIHGDLSPRHVYIDEDFNPLIFGYKSSQETNNSTAKQDDIYNFGVISYHLITGNDKFDISLVENSWQRKLLSKCTTKYRWYRPEFDEIVSELHQHQNEFDEVTKIDRKIERYTSWYSQRVKENAESGDIKEMFIYASFLSENARKKEASKFFKMAADFGQTNSMFNYAFMLSKGDGIQTNKREASEYYKKAIEKGNRTAMFNFAHMLFNGDGIQKNLNEAAKFYKMAADQGNVKAMFNYAVLAAKGDGVQINKKEAAKYFKLAADQGNVKAMGFYASMLCKGDGTKVDKIEAARYYKEAADLDNIDAMIKLASMFEIGDGVQADKSEALKYFKRAADLGNTDGIENYERLSKM